MASLAEYKVKQIFSKYGIEIPRSNLVTSIGDLKNLDEVLRKDCVIKAQILTTSRASIGGIKFAKDESSIEHIVSQMLNNYISGHLCTKILIEQRIPIDKEYFIGYAIDDSLKRPILFFSNEGGSGIEERANTTKRFICSVIDEPLINDLAIFTGNFNIAKYLLKLYRIAKKYDARSVEINPLALTKKNELIALDGRISVDDYAVFRHPELGIDIARELGHEPTKLERLAWEVEKEDFRGTFYFVEITENQNESILKGRYLIGFHGAGGGGAMASMDAAVKNSLMPACYVDTSGNPPASKVYRAARLILSIPNIKGYFLSGSGVASQEQYVIARAILRAFMDMNLRMPAVLRLGGNGEELAKQIIEKYSHKLNAKIEAFQKTHTADQCAARLRILIVENVNKHNHESDNENSQTCFNHDLDTKNAYSFKTRTGRVYIDHKMLDESDAQRIVDSCPVNILTLNAQNMPVLAIDVEDAYKGKCIECFACEYASYENGRGGVRLEFPVAGLTYDDFNT